MRHNENVCRYCGVELKRREMKDMICRECDEMREREIRRRNERREKREWR